MIPRLEGTSPPSRLPAIHARGMFAISISVLGAIIIVCCLCVDLEARRCAHVDKLTESNHIIRYFMMFVLFHREVQEENSELINQAISCRSGRSKLSSQERTKADIDDRSSASGQVLAFFLSFSQTEKGVKRLVRSSRTLFSSYPDRSIVLLCFFLP
jgi:hypothetical protein